MPGQYSSQATVIDAILALTYALPAVQGSGDTPPVTVFDGPPGGAGNPQQWIAIMGDGEADTVVNNLKWASLGAFLRDEVYSINGEIYCYVGGDDNLGQFQPATSNAQQTARTQATALLNALEAALINDPDLSDQNDGNELVNWVLMARSQLVQTSPDEQATAGRWALYKFSILVSNQLHP